MDLDTHEGVAPEAPPPAKKAPRKPRPSEIAAKKAKAAKRKAKSAPKKKVAKPKAKKPAKRKAPAKKAKAAKPKAKPARKGNGRPLVRSERLDMRITKEEKRKLEAKAKRLKRTVTSVALEAIMKMR